MWPNYIHDIFFFLLPFAFLQEGQVSSCIEYTSSNSSGIQVNEGPYMYIILCFIPSKMAAQSKADSENHVSVTHKL